MTDFILIDAKWFGDCTLSVPALDKIKNMKTISVFSSVNFLEQKKDLIKQLESTGHIILTAHADRAEVAGQILGCDSYAHSFDKDVFGKSDAILYLGDGNFHPDALLFAQIYSDKKILPVFVWNPVNQKLSTYTIDKIFDKIRKMKANLIKYSMSKRIGILVTTKYGQENLKLAELLKEKLDQEGKKAYIFVDNTFPFSKIEDYNFIDSWVNSACPRIGQDDVTVIDAPIINIREAFDVDKYLAQINCSVERK